MHSAPSTALLGVLSVSEAAAAYGVIERTIRYHIDVGNLTFRKAGNFLLIDKSSLERLHQRIYDAPMNFDGVYIHQERMRKYALQHSDCN